MQIIQMQQLGWLYPFLACEACVLFRAQAHTQKHRQAPLQLNKHTHMLRLVPVFSGKWQTSWHWCSRCVGVMGWMLSDAKGSRVGERRSRSGNIEWLGTGCMGERRRRRRERTCLAYDTKPQESDRNDEVISTEGGKSEGKWVEDLMKWGEKIDTIILLIVTQSSRSKNTETWRFWSRPLFFPQSGKFEAK